MAWPVEFLAHCRHRPEEESLEIAIYKRNLETNLPQVTHAATTKTNFSTNPIY